MTIYRGHFDGKHSLVFDEPVDLPVGTPLRVHVEAESTQQAAEIGNGVSHRKWRPLDIQIDPELSNAIALDPEFDIEES
jgi:hypothetical protein